MSQERLSRRLGFSSNVLYLWERRKRLPSIGTFFRLADLRRRGFRDGLRGLTEPRARPAEAHSRAPDDPLDIPALLRRLSGGQPGAQLSRLTGFDRATIARWLAGTTEPRLPDFLEYLDKTTLRLLDFVALFADPSKLDVTRRAFDEHQKRRKLAYEHPWSHAVLHALELSEYQRQPSHRSSLLAQKLGLSVEQVEGHLARLADARLIEKRDGRWSPKRVLTVDTSSDFDANRRLKHHWATVVTRRVEDFRVEAQSLFSYNMFPIARAELAQLREAHLEYFQRVRQLVSNARDADHIVLMNVQLCLLDEGVEPSAKEIQIRPGQVLDKAT
jgi:transcriptional regulator with XRE-family HTH domain